MLFLKQKCKLKQEIFDHLYLKSQTYILIFSFVLLLTRQLISFNEILTLGWYRFRYSKIYNTANYFLKYFLRYKFKF